MAKQGFFGKDRAKNMAIAFSILVGLLFLIEIVAIPLSYQNPGQGGTNPEDYSTKFQNVWIYDNITQDEKNYLIANSRTVAVYNYTDNPNFFEIEKTVNELSGQLVLERQKSDQVSMYFQSSRGSETVENLTTQNIFSSLCLVLTAPRVDCVSVVSQ